MANGHCRVQVPSAHFACSTNFIATCLHNVKQNGIEIHLILGVLLRISGLRIKSHSMQALPHVTEA